MIQRAFYLPFSLFISLNRDKVKWLSLLLVMWSYYGLAQVKVVVSPAEKVATVGEVFSIDVKVEAGEQRVDAANVYLTFDKAVVEVVSVTPGSSLSVPLLTARFDNSTGLVSYAYGTFSDFPSGVFTLFTLQLRAIASGTSALNFETINNIPTDLSYSTFSVLHQRVNGQVQVTGVTSLDEELPVKGKVQVYPNPGNGKFRLSVKDQGQQQGRATVTSASGKLVQTFGVQLGTTHETEIDLSSQAPGIYFLRLENGCGSSVHRLVKY